MNKIMPVLFFVLFGNGVSGQISFFVKGAFQKASVGITETRTKLDKYQSKWGWYTGGQVEYVTTENVILFGGAGLSFIRYEQKLMEMADARITNNYKLLFLEIPLGFGYQFRPSKKINLNLYVGGYYNIGIAGRKEQFLQSYYQASGPGYGEYRESKKIKFGVDEDWEDDFRKVNAGIQAGFAIGLSNKLYVESLYKHGITNILHKNEEQYENKKIRTFSLGFKYNLINPSKQKKEALSTDKKGF